MPPSTPTLNSVQSDKAPIKPITPNTIIPIMDTYIGQLGGGAYSFGSQRRNFSICLRSLLTCSGCFRTANPAS